MQWVDDAELGRVPLAYSPIRWHGSPIFELDGMPALGRDNDAVFGELLGLDADAMAALRTAAIV
jgi:crotonobetainyl-CoA:carnitine CoA-transferase CaiB-like acyl-CoA transferase